MAEAARRYVVRGRVQGVGYRYFVERNAVALGLAGWVRNCDDGSVEVEASGDETVLADLEGLLWKGPRMADVRGVETTEAVPAKRSGFRIR